MSTIATPAMRAFADSWENALPSAVLSGIVGDRAHQAEGGYHISREDQSSDNYSVQLAEDRAGQSNWASAVDMNHNPAEMRLVTQRLINSADDQNDPRLNYCREFYGTVDGRTVVGRDTYYGRFADSDDSHLWHVHISFLRKYANDPAAMAAVLSVIRGEPFGSTTPATPGGSTMSDYTPFGRPAVVGDRGDSVMIADLWSQLLREDSPYTAGNPAPGIQRQRRIETKVDQLLAEIKAARADIAAMKTTGGIDVVALAAALAPKLPAVPSLADIAKAVADETARRQRE